MLKRIPNEINDEIFAVYHEYEGDHTKPYSYFIGCKMDVMNADSAKQLSEGFGKIMQKSIT